MSEVSREHRGPVDPSPKHTDCASRAPMSPQIAKIVQYVPSLVTIRRLNLLLLYLSLLLIRSSKLIHLISIEGSLRCLLDHKFAILSHLESKMKRMCTRHSFLPRLLMTSLMMMVLIRLLLLRIEMTARIVKAADSIQTVIISYWVILLLILLLLLMM